MLTLVSVMLIAAVACFGYGNVGTLKSTVETGGAVAVQAKFTLNRGALELGGGASGLMQGEFATNSRNDPAIDYAVHERQGTLTVAQAAVQTGFGIAPIENNWSINLNDEMPLDLEIDNGGAHADLNLDTLTVSKLSLSSSVGGAAISIAGVQPELTSVGLNSTSGDVQLQMNGNYARRHAVNVSSTSGSISADLSGRSAADVTGSFKSATGPITIVVPSAIGVEIEISTTSGTVDASGLTERSAGTFVNAAFGSTKVTMLLNVRTTSGAIKLRVAK
jgi:hypothetical protein